MNRKIIWFIACALIVSSLAGCGKDKDDETVSPDVRTLADMLVAGLEFEDSVSEVSVDTAIKYYGISDGEVQDSVSYISTGATSEELSVFEAVTDSDAQNILAAMKSRRDSQIQVYLDYKPDEVNRLDNAVLYAHGRFVVYAVSDDSDKAHSIISGYLE